MNDDVRDNCEMVRIPMSTTFLQHSLNCLLFSFSEGSSTYDHRRNEDLSQATQGKSRAGES